jgi:hypothetical protein
MGTAACGLLILDAQDYVSRLQPVQRLRNHWQHELMHPSFWIKSRNRTPFRVMETEKIISLPLNLYSSRVKEVFTSLQFPMCLIRLSGCEGVEVKAKK